MYVCSEIFVKCKMCTCMRKDKLYSVSKFGKEACRDGNLKHVTVNYCHTRLIPCKLKQPIETHTHTQITSSLTSARK